ncbi:hypothetical protein PIB30_053708 [Stylosanthes scabra]|uniref:Uncharacterized protein n=1 Tax=Stylosanthes scabra TaxID=79078 RepID=A0ABU6QI28_9FABA|nr:hypothetical protein [Stylosanthes scabra]
MFESTLQRFRIDSVQVTQYFAGSAIMSRRKTPAIKLTSAPCKVPPPLSQVPLRRWFTNKIIGKNSKISTLRCPS